MKEVLRTAKRETIVIGILAATEGLIALPVNHEVSAGILYGSLFSIICFWLIARDVMAMSTGAKAPVWGYMARYVLYAVCLGTSAYFGSMVFLGAVIGVFNLKFSLYIFGRWLSEA